MQAILEGPRARPRYAETWLRPREAEVEDPDDFDVRLARGGSRIAFDRLILRHQHAVLSAAAFSLSNHEDALDAAQEAFLKAYRSLPRFRGSSTFKTWILRIAINSARSLRVRQKAQKRGGQIREERLHRSRSDGLESDSCDAPAPCDWTEPTRILERIEVKEALEDAISALDETDREVIVLRDLSGQSYEGIAAALRLPLGTVKSRVHRARLQLRSRMEPFL